MVVDDLITSPSHRLSKLLGLLESLYDITIDFEAATSPVELKNIYEAYGAERNRIMNEEAFNSYSHNSEYTKAILIQEAIHLFLSEVAPKRMSRSKSSS